MIVSWAIDIGGSFPLSAMNAVHTSFFDVARIRADPLNDPVPVTFELTEIPTAVLVPKIRVAPEGMLRDVVTASFVGAPPVPGKISTPTCIGTVSVEVQEKNVASPVKPPMTPGTE
jgi:hypothetical protein